MEKTIQYKNGNTLAYTDVGPETGNPVLVQHGLIASIQDYYLFERLIEAGRRVISIARPGYGRSSPYEMRAIGEWGEIVVLLVDQLRLRQFDVLGISSGAPYSYAIGYQHPDRVRNLFILSGTPALYDENVRAVWPYPVSQGASMAEMQALAYELFFSHLSQADLEKDDIRDSIMNGCFGVAQDLRMRGINWGFRLQDVKSRVIMRHSRTDEAVPFTTAEMTCRLLPNCRLEMREQDVHFSQEVLDDFIRSAVV